MEVVLIITGIILVCGVSVLFHFLTFYGGIAAFITGFVIYLSFDWKGLVILGVFFVTSSFLTKWKKEKKPIDHVVEDETKKGRTAGQVFANGGMALLAATGGLCFPNPIWLLMFTGAFASAAADTWASEIGTLSKGKPFHIKEWRRVERGLSGAVSTLGTVAAVWGALVIAVTFYLLYMPSMIFLLIITFSGFLGNAADTILGAWLEPKRLCSVCKKDTEAMFHCGIKTTKIFGVSWFTNNIVNFTSTIVGASMAGGIFVWLIN